MSTSHNQALSDRLTVHPDLDELYGELHSRPSQLLDVPLRASHVAMISTQHEIAESREHLARLAKRYSATAPVPDTSFYHQSFGGFDLRWEKHTEFYSLTIFSSGVSKQPFENPAFGLLPEDWVYALPGCLVAAAHAAMLGVASPEPTDEDLKLWFEGQLVVGSNITSNRAAAWTTFRRHRDGFCRYLVLDKGLSRFQAGRTLQRLLELETYRVMSLLSLPAARRLASETTQLDSELAEIMDRFMLSDSLEHERSLLADLSAIAATVERHRSTTNYRFGATRAYYRLVNEILADLREKRFAGRSSMAKFLERRLGPGVRTCFAMQDRLENLSRRVGRAGELLQARINVAIETQNQSLLETMNRRSGMQLRLQQTVEGLSVAAISYYSVALLKILFDSLAELGVPIKPEFATGVALPVVIGAVWYLVRRIRRRISPEVS